MGGSHLFQQMHNRIKDPQESNGWSWFSPSDGPFFLAFGHHNSGHHLYSKSFSVSWSTSEPWPQGTTGNSGKNMEKHGFGLWTLVVLFKVKGKAILRVKVEEHSKNMDPEHKSNAISCPKNNCRGGSSRNSLPNFRMTATSRHVWETSSSNYVLISRGSPALVFQKSSPHEPRPS